MARDTAASTRVQREADVQAKKIAPLVPVGTLAERTADAIRAHILSGHFESGERIVEAQLARELGISRGPVREALKQLRAEGLVRDEPRRGTFVVKLEADDVREIYELRAAIETRAVRVLTTHRDAAALGALRQALDRIADAASSGDPRAAARADIGFHGEACRQVGNERLYRVFTTHADILQALLKLENERFYDDLGEIWSEHRELLDAVEAGDPAAAERLWEEHLSRTRDRLIDYLGELLEHGG